MRRCRASVPCILPPAWSARRPQRPLRGGELRLFRLIRRGLKRRKPAWGAGWSGRRDSNPRPSAWEADALPLSYTRPLLCIIANSTQAAGSLLRVARAACPRPGALFHRPRQARRSWGTGALSRAAPCSGRRDDRGRSGRGGTGVLWRAASRSVPLPTAALAVARRRDTTAARRPRLQPAGRATRSRGVRTRPQHGPARCRWCSQVVKLRPWQPRGPGRRDMTVARAAPFAPRRRGPPATCASPARRRRWLPRRRGSTRRLR